MGYCNLVVLFHKDKLDQLLLVVPVYSLMTELLQQVFDYKGMLPVRL
jgi:hypothetical protein